MSAPFHPGELKVQARAGVRHAASRVGGMIRPGMTADHAAFVAEQGFAVLAAEDAHGRMWASPLNGSPGFLRPLDAVTVEVVAALPPGDPLAETLGRGGVAGMVVVDFETRRRVRLNGRMEARNGGGFLLRLIEAYGNCPKYIQRRVPETAGADVPFLEPARLTKNEILTQEQQDQVAKADTFFIASVHGERADASHRGGKPGFVHVGGAAVLRWPDYPGNTLFNTLGNLATDPRSGLLFLDFEEDRALQLTGTARILWDEPCDGTSRGPGEERAVEFRIEGVIEQRPATGRRWRLMERSPHNP